MNAPTNMPIAPHAHIKHKIAWRKCKNFPMGATVHLISSHNPWRPGSFAWPLFDILRKKPMSTVQEILDDAAEIGFYHEATMLNLKWLYTWGDFIEIDGQRYFPKQTEV